MFERFGSQNEGKNNRISRNSACGEQSGNFPKNVVLYLFLQYINEVRMYEICVKTVKFQLFVQKNAARKNTAEISPDFPICKRCWSHLGTKNQSEINKKRCRKNDRRKYRKNMSEVGTWVDRSAVYGRLPGR